jgi:hypothetical protein
MRTISLLCAAALLWLSIATPTQAQRGQSANAAATYQLRPEEVPAGFEHREDRDVNLSMPGVERATRFYTRGDPEVPTEEHASLLVAVAVSDQPSDAREEFETAMAGWTTRDFAFESLGRSLGDQAMLGRSTYFRDSLHPKEAILILFRDDRINVAVQWTDDFSQPNADNALWIAEVIGQRLEGRS